MKLSLTLQDQDIISEAENSNPFGGIVSFAIGPVIQSKLMEAGFCGDCPIEFHRAEQGVTYTQEMNE
jgi:hypothetical protein